MGNYNFRKDLEIAKKCEERVAEFLKEKGATEIEFNNDNKWDIKFYIDRRSYTMEVKEDILAKVTGNVAIEIESRGKPSGIKRSEADIWLYVIGENFYSCKLPALQSFIEKENFRTVKGGDGGTSKILLLPLRDFYKIFKKVK